MENCVIKKTCKHCVCEQKDKNSNRNTVTVEM